MKAHFLSIYSYHNKLEEVIAFIERISQRESWPADMKERVLLAASEAATNAMEHGNKFDPLKTVSITVDADDASVILSVRDEGNGFLRNEVPDPLAKENLLRESGRGLFIIEQLADDVSYRDGGREIVLRFDWPDANSREEA